MTDIESRLADTMRRIADEPGGPPPREALLMRGRRARRHRRLTLMGGACLAVAALVVVPAMVPDARQTPAGDARMRLVAAVSSSESLSYRLRITSNHTDESGRRSVLEGSFDPATRTGRLSSAPGDPAGLYDQRLIAGTVYISYRGGPFKTMWGTSGHLRHSDALGSGLAATANPLDLFAALRAANATVTQTGPVGYRFEADLAPSPGISSDRLTGEVIVNADDRIEKVTYERIMVGRLKSGDPITVTESFTVELFGYGEPVSVERPANPVPATPPGSPKPWIEIVPFPTPSP